MWKIIQSEWQKIRRCQILLVGIVALGICPLVQYGSWLIMDPALREPQYDFSALFAQHSSDMIGFFIQALQKENMSPVEKKALHYGVNALLHTTDERS